MFDVWLDFSDERTIFKTNVVSESTLVYFPFLIPFRGDLDSISK